MKDYDYRKPLIGQKVIQLSDSICDEDNGHQTFFIKVPKGYRRLELGEEILKTDLCGSNMAYLGWYEPSGAIGKPLDKSHLPFIRKLEKEPRYAIVDNTEIELTPEQEAKIEENNRQFIIKEGDIVCERFGKVVRIRRWTGTKIDSRSFKGFFQETVFKVDAETVKIFERNEIKE